jgi:membrane associated rhomboid family serine protease
VRLGGEPVIPIRDANPTTRTPWFTLTLIAVNVAVFLVWQPTFGTQFQQTTFFFCHAEIPWEVSHQTNLAQGGREAVRALDRDWGAASGAPIQRYLRVRCPAKSWWIAIFVSMFLHGGWLHIGGNMLFLWIFGNNVEDRLGRVVFLLLYVLGGIAAMLLQLAFGASSTVPAIGASGAIAGVLGAYLVLFPQARVTTLVFFFLITWIELPAFVVLLLWFGLQLLSGVGQFGQQLNGGVAYWAHVGGFLFGVAVVWLLFRRRRGSRAGGVPRRPDYR